MYIEDTIAAIATPPGPGGIGIVRVSGPLAEHIGRTLFTRDHGGEWTSHHLYHGRVLRPDGQPLDEALAVLMRAPRSHTGEDVLEIHCHGSPVILREVLATCMRHGARPAQPGEFTKRAFLNGRIDLAQAEAVIDLVRSRTSEGAAQAVDQLFGHLSSHLAALRSRLVRVKAQLEVQLDFAEEEITVDGTALTAEMRSLLEETERLLRTYEHGRLVREGLRVAIVGPPNVGKSSLLNALLGTERAIVTATPGTTRDVIEESADFDGVPVVLSDTAGLRDTTDEVERLGVERTHVTARNADVLLVVIDGSVPPGPLSAATDTARVVFALNKADLPRAWPDAEVRRLEHRGSVVAISATQRRGLDELRRTVVGAAATRPPDGLPVLTTARQRDALQNVRDGLAEASASLDQNRAPELIAVDVQDALDHLGRITGEVTTEEVLDAIFAEFCIGK